MFRYILFVVLIVIINMMKYYYLILCFWLFFIGCLDISWEIDVWIYMYMLGEKRVLVVWWIIYVFVKDIISVNFVFLYELVVLI